MQNPSATTAAIVAFLAFLAILMLAFGLYRLGSLAVYRRRLAESLRFFWRTRAKAEPGLQTTSSGASKRTEKIIEQLSRLSVPEEGWQNDGLRLRFIRAGLDFDRFGRLYFASRTVLTVIVPVVASLVYMQVSDMPTLQTGALIALVLAAAGYYGPEQLLGRLTTQRRLQMQLALPDILDLLVICTEAGLSLDQAIGRVAKEIARHSPTAAREFQLVSLSVRAGIPRSIAFRNLALRTELDDLATFATMVIQAERFGTGIATSLRSQSELMRVRRMQRAEETAAKLPTKLLMPLVLFVFPSLFIVILGPAISGMGNLMGN